MNLDDLVKSRHSREGGNPCARNFLKRMDSRLRTSGMTAMKRTFYEVVNLNMSSSSFRAGIITLILPLNFSLLSSIGSHLILFSAPINLIVIIVHAKKANPPNIWNVPIMVLFSTFAVYRPMVYCSPFGVFRPYFFILYPICLGVRPIIRAAFA